MGFNVSVTFLIVNPNCKSADCETFHHDLLLTLGYSMRLDITHMMAVEDVVNNRHVGSEQCHDNAKMISLHPSSVRLFGVARKRVKQSGRQQTYLEYAGGKLTFIDTQNLVVGCGSVL